MIDGIGVSLHKKNTESGRYFCYAFRRMWESPLVGDEIILGDGKTYCIVFRKWDVRVDHGQYPELHCGIKEIP